MTGSQIGNTDVRRKPTHSQREVVLTGEEQDEAAGEEVRVGAEPGHSDGHGLRQRVAHGVVGEGVDVVAESSSHTRRSYSNRNNSINSIYAQLMLNSSHQQYSLVQYNSWIVPGICILYLSEPVCSQ